MTDSLLREFLDPSNGPVALTMWRTVMVAGRPRLAEITTRRAPDQPPVYRLVVYREEIPKVMRLTKQGAAKLLAAMKDGSTWEASSEVSVQDALEWIWRRAAGDDD